MDSKTYIRAWALFMFDQGKSTKETVPQQKEPHAPYSPDLAPSDYHLFRSMEHSLRNMQFANIHHVQKWVGDFVCLQASHVLRYRDPKPTRKMQEHNSYTGGILHWLDFVLFSNKNSKQTIKMTKLFTQPNMWLWESYEPSRVSIVRNVS